MISRRALFLVHGGGPLPLLNDPAHDEMVACLQSIADSIERPSAIIVVSAHWESSCATVTTRETNRLLYDYRGFPEESYALKYECPTTLDVAHTVTKCLRDARLEVATNSTRGFDHGLFVPMKVMYPDASILCIQCSLIDHMDPESHIKLGEALQSLHDPSILIVGSGFPFHNLRAFFFKTD